MYTLIHIGISLNYIIQTHTVDFVFSSGVSVFFIDFKLDIEYSLIRIVCLFFCVCACVLIYVCVSLCCFIMSKYASKSTCTDNLVEPSSDKVSRDVSTPAGENTLLQSDGINLSMSRVWSTVTVIANGQFSKLSWEGDIVDF